MSAHLQPNQPKHILFIGVVGHAMRGIALAAKERGNIVTGLDEAAAPGPGADWVTNHGLEWTRTPSLGLLDGLDLIIISGGTSVDTELMAEARRRHISIMSFAEYLGELTSGKHVIAVAGTHGKTTTTALIAWLLNAAGRRPDYMVGIRPFNFDSSARLTGSAVFVVEGDEYRASGLDDTSKVQYYHPDILVLTSVEHDHPDVFPTLESVINRFKAVVAKLPATGRLIAWAANRTVAEVAAASTAPVTTYGLETGDYTPRNVAYLPSGIEFDVENSGGILGRVAVPLYGKHNVLNVLAAVAVARGEDISMEQIVSGAATFRGAYRRFNIVSPPDAPITVIDDYAHHPTEATTNIEAAKLHFPGRRVVVIYRPHTFSRTAALLPEYQAAFSSADLVYITDIEAARESGQDHTVSGHDITKALTVPALYITDRASLMHNLKLDTKSGDVILCFSVSGYENLAGELAQTLNPE